MIIIDHPPYGKLTPTLAALCGLHPNGASLDADRLRQQSRVLGVESQKDPSQWQVFMKEHLAKKAESGTL